MNSRRYLTLFSAVVLVPLLAATSFASAQFTDVPTSSWFASYVSQAVQEGIVSGYNDYYGNPTGKFGPDNPVTVGEALKISLEGAGYDTSKGVGYGHWAAKYMSVALGLGFDMVQVHGLNLDRPATRAEVASLFTNAFKVDDTTFTGGQYSDVTAATPYAGAIQALTKTSIVAGDKDSAGNPVGRFRPNDQVNRAEAVKIVIGARAAYGRPGQGTSVSSSSRSSSRSSSAACTTQDCGIAPAMPNWQCPNGSIAGPSCEKLPDGRCGWLIRQCSMTSSSSSRSSSSSSKYAPVTYIITYTDNGFQPSFLRIRLNDIVKFRNQSTIGMWVASNPHPEHSDYSEFDQKKSVNPGGEFSFTFKRVGVWGFHNDVKISSQGVISVDPS